MNRSLSFSAFGHATSLFLAISFVLCVAGDLIMPAHEMHTAWQRLLPGFDWISWGSFFLGLVESYAWGWYVTLIWVPLYNVISARQQVAAAAGSKS
jgi:hypothetical protein